MELSREQLRQIRRQDRQREGKRFRAVLLATILIFVFCLCFRYNAYYYPDKFVPVEYFRSYITSLRLLFARVTDAPLWYKRTEVIDSLDSVIYYGAQARLRITLVSFVAGAALSLSGAIFQTAYRNPMAPPNIIGASAGVGLGNVMVVMACSAAAMENIFLRYEYCYGFTVVCVGLVLLLGRLSSRGNGNYSVLEMVMAGSVISQIVRVFTMYFMYEMEDADLVLYEQISLGTYLQTDKYSMIIFFTVMALAIIPVWLLRYRLNTLSMDRMEANSLGISPGGLRIVAQLCGVLMVTCSMIHCGEIGMVSLVIPYVLRRRIGCDFRYLCRYCILIGGSLLMLCRLVTSFIYIQEAPIPVTFIIETALIPAFLIVLATYNRRANEA